MWCKIFFSIGNIFLLRKKHKKESSHVIPTQNFHVVQKIPRLRNLSFMDLIGINILRQSYWERF